MSLLQKASIITTPTAYAEDYLYSIKPAYALGSELVTNGDFSNGSNNWNVQTGWSIANGIATVNHNATTAITQSLSGVRANFLYEIKLTISNYTQGLIQPQFGGQVITQFTENGEHTFQVVSTSSTPTLYLYAISNPQFSIDNVSIKEINKADFDFDRNSTGTRVNEDYLIEDVPYNLLKYSEDISNSSWAKQNGGTGSVPTVSSNYSIAPDGTQTADRVIFNLNGGTANADVSQIAFTFGNTSSGDFTNSVYIKSNTANNYNLVLTIPSGSFQTKTITTEWQRFTTTSSNTTNVTLRIRLRGDESTSDYADVSIWGAQIVKGDQPKDYLKTTDRLDIPRIDYTNGEGSILLEPQRTNSVAYSNDFSNSHWSNQQTTESDNVAISPEGLQNASKLIEDSSNNRHIIFDSMSSSAGTVYTFSVFLKKGERNYATLRLDDDSPIINTWFNLESGTVGTMNSESASIEDYGNGWYRCSVQYTADSSIMFAVIATAPSDNVLYYQGDGTSGVFMYGAQVEAGSYATSLIHTSGSAVTRSADVANNAGNSDLINSTEGVLYAEIKALADDGTSRDISVSDNTSSNYARISLSNATGNIEYNVVVGGATQASGLSAISQTNFNKIALKYKLNDFSLYINGTEALTDSSGSIFPSSTLTSLNFNRGSATNFFYGNAKMVAVFKEALTDLELEKLTGYNNHELYMNYYNRLSYLGLVEEYNVESDINNYIL